jgi:hypothetical protein
MFESECQRYPEILLPELVPLPRNGQDDEVGPGQGLASVRGLLNVDPGAVVIANQLGYRIGAIKRSFIGINQNHAAIRMIQGLAPHRVGQNAPAEALAPGADHDNLGIW